MKELPVAALLPPQDPPFLMEPLQNLPHFDNRILPLAQTSVNMGRAPRSDDRRRGRQRTQTHRYRRHAFSGNTTVHVRAPWNSRPLRLPTKVIPYFTFGDSKRRLRLHDRKALLAGTD